MKKTNRRAPTVLYIGAMLLCALLITSHMMGGIYARYASFDQGEASARVAKFEFTETLTPQTKTFVLSGDAWVPKQTLPIKVSVTNSGEVTIRYTIKVENLTNNLPIESKTVTEVVAMGATETVSVEIVWNETETGTEYAGKTDVLRISVTAEQVD